MSFGKDCMDYCWKSWQRHKDDNIITEKHDNGNNTEDNNSNSNSNNNNSGLNRKALTSICLLRSVHCSVVFEDIQNLCNGNNPIVLENPATELEEYVIASSRMFFDVKDGPSDTTSAWVRQELEDIAAVVRQRLSQEDPSTEEQLEALNHVFFDQLQFSGNTDDYYDFHNSLLHTSLRRRTGIPMTLAILYKCLARRISLHVEIIGLPGHIVIGVPSLDRYVDVFRRGRRLLTVEDCERIVNSYGQPMVPEYLLPWTPAQVFRRILNNCGNSLAQIFPPNASKRMAIEAMRAVLINPSNDQVEDCRRWFSQILWGASSDAILREMSMW